MKYIFILIILVIGSVWVLAALRAIFDRDGKPLWRWLMGMVAGALMAVGIVVFLSGGLSAAGGLNWLPTTFEWPAGHVSGVLTMQHGEHVVPLPDAGRIQIYDRQWRFVRGWHVEASGGDFKMVPAGNDQFDVYTAKRVKGGQCAHYVFSIDGRLISQSSYPNDADTYNAVPNVGVAAVVPTRIWLWVFSSPLYGWEMAIVGMLLLAVSQGNLPQMNRRGAKREHVAVHRVGEAAPSAMYGEVTAPPVEFRTTGAGEIRSDHRRFSFANFGCLLSTLVWTLGWVVVACIAIKTVRHVSNPSAVVGVVTSVVMVLIGLRVISRSDKKAKAPKKEPVEQPSLGRQIGGWVASLVWCGVALIWNIGIFGVLCQQAAKGSGWFMLLLVIWSLVGWFLLVILFVHIGGILDWIRKIFVGENN
ncbi:MAG TPA: hypothetical protein VGG19_09075 [Tepidisphaeraceae bacterium]|jgi:threonine/homoserine/homoserine lactone efflux protein